MTPRLALDPALPLRDILLDEAAMAQRLASLFGWSERSCRLARVTYKPGRSVRLVYDVDGLVVGARAYPACRPVKPGGGLATDPLLNALFWAFPNDRRVTHLPDAMSRWPESRLVAYAPEKSATLQCIDADGNVSGYAKVTHHSQRQQLMILQALPVTQARLRLPRVLEISADGHTLLFEALPGTRLADTRSGDLERLGGALAHLHGLPLDDGPRFARFDPHRICEAAADIGLVRPDLRAIAATVAQGLLAALPSVTAPVWLHGDVHLKNALADGDRIGLIDFEDAAIGPAAADLASVLAELRYQRRVGSLLRREEHAAADSFLAGYADVRPLPDDLILEWHLAAALLVERALGAINRLRPEGLQHLDILLADAAALVKA